jgi:hypothetical protein
MNGPAHPLWCEPTRCETSLGGGHSSEPRTVNFDGNGPGFCRLRVWRRWPGPTYIELIAGNIDNGQRCRSDLTVAQAMQLESLLSAVLGQIDDESS